MPEEFIICTTSDGVATVTLNRPDVLNSFNGAMALALQATFASFAKDASVRAVLLTGAGRAFCAGQDLDEALAQSEKRPNLGAIVRRTWNPIIRAIRTIEKPVVCAVNGVAAGAGANVAFACDITFASANATFVQSFAKIGLIPDSGGTFILPRIVGLQRAAALTMLAERITAAQALEYGLIYKVCEAAALSDASRAAAQQLAAMPTRALGLIKRGFNRSLGIDLDAQLDLEADLQHEAGGTADYSEGVRAFVEKRKPRFTGL
jgi:2-(1,2-epoxy-1,2-dihydrophenyl)acetyl-CoA isomerase